MTCRNGHDLVAAFSGAPQYNCDICNSGARPDDYHFGCRVCNFDVCPTCMPPGDQSVDSAARGVGRLNIGSASSPAASGGSGGIGLVKAGSLRLEDTNVALIGSDLDKKARFEASGHEPAWATAGKAPGLEAWRIEQFKVVPLPREQYGTFYAGDSYIVLSTYQSGNNPELKFDLHFWLGEDTTQDKAGTAAYKTVELDDHLGCTPVEHRQVQGHEDDLFLSYWRPAMRLHDGGVPSGFKHYTAPDWPKKLYWVHGHTARNLRMSEIKIDVSLVHSSGAFVLDHGMEIRQFNGSRASGFAREKAGVFAQGLVSERDSRPVLTVGEEGDDEANHILELVGGSAGQAIAASAQVDAPPSHEIEDRKIFNYHDLSIVAEGLSATRSQLQTNRAYVVDLGNEVYVWVGKLAEVGHHKHALQKAIDYLRKFNRPFHLPIHRIIEGNENDAFNNSF